MLQTAYPLAIISNVQGQTAYVMLLCGLQGGYLLILAGNCGLKGFDVILLGLNGLGDDILQLRRCQDKNRFF